MNINVFAGLMYYLIILQYSLLYCSDFVDKGDHGQNWSIRPKNPSISQGVRYHWGTCAKPGHTHLAEFADSFCTNYGGRHIFYYV